MPLPTFPEIDTIPRDEDGFERVVERLCDKADKAFMSGKCTEAQYEQWFADLNEWSAKALAAL